MNRPVNHEEYEDYIDALEYQLEVTNITALEYEKKLRELLDNKSFTDFINHVSSVLIKKDIDSRKDSDFKTFLSELYNHRKNK